MGYMLIITVILFLFIIISYIIDSRNVLFDSHLSDTFINTQFPKQEEDIYIDRHIYRIWFGSEKQENIEALNSIKKILPDYKISEIKSYDDAEKFILKYYNKNILDIFNLISKDYPACKSDLLRLLLIYAKGGVYLDSKSSIKKDITYELNKYKDNLLVFNWYNFPFISPYWHKTITFENPNFLGEICNWGFACNKGNPVLREIINCVLWNIKKAYMNKEKYNTGHPYILSLTGPHVLTWRIHHTKNKHKVKILRARFNGKFVYTKTEHDRSKNHWKKNKKKLFI